MSDNAQTSRVVLNGLIPGSPAEKAGMKKGDTILSVNGVAIKNFDDYIIATNNISASGKQTMDVLRNGSLIEVNLIINKVSSIDYGNIVNQLQANGSLPTTQQEEPRKSNNFYN